MTEYRMSLSREVDARLKMKCYKLSNAFVLDDNGKFGLHISDLIWGCNSEIVIYNLVQLDDTLFLGSDSSSSGSQSSTSRLPERFGLIEVF
jgi:hypothetical protein